MYSNESSTVSVAEVSTVVRIRSSSSSRTMSATSIGEARRNMPLPRNSTKYTYAAIVGPHQKPEVIPDLPGASGERRRASDSPDSTSSAAVGIGARHGTAD